MKVLIQRVKGDAILTNVDFTDVSDKGEVSHIICELEIIKQKLLFLWKELDDKESISAKVKVDEN